MNETPRQNDPDTTCETNPSECGLDCLARGQKARVAHVDGPNRCRLMELGFTCGAEVEIARRGAFGGPIEVRLRSYRLSLRRDEAERIRVELPLAVEMTGKPGPSAS